MLKINIAGSHDFRRAFEEYLRKLAVSAGPALEFLRKGLQLTPADPELLFKAALVYNQFGDVPQALSWLEKAVSEGFSQTTVRDTPNFDHLRSDPRFQELLRPK